MNKSIQNKKNLHDIHLNIINTKNDIRKSFLKLGALLHLAKSKKVYMNEGYEEFKHYLADPQINIKYQTADTLVSIYREFILKLEIKP